MLVVELTLGFIAEDLVSAGDLLEFLLGLLVARIAVRVKLHRLLAIGLLELIGGRRLRDAQQGVIFVSHRSRLLGGAGGDKDCRRADDAVME